jgi:hypothetical protein
VCITRNSIKGEFLARLFTLVKINELSEFFSVDK